ncbi:GAF domain-containing protein [Nakamurella endophytica]|uniref:GAF domain-containing protein n=1 Tax=Nakamurella endophytica TaxID=1748367 RepID=A0A917WAA1_9ACTN|nr:GAF domain-containing protein [Nakamurella endophytica]GGL85298.1 hypothetical protein GCM10011594_01220 [Nakamurella endophytica]
MAGRTAGGGVRRPEGDAGRAWDARRYLDGLDTAHLRPVLDLARRATGFPAAMVNVLDLDTQHTVAVIGLDRVDALPRHLSLCDTVVRTEQPLVLPDASRDSGFRDNLRVRTGMIGAYVGVPVRGREGAVVGTLCVTDARPHPVLPAQVECLQQLAEVVRAHLDLLRGLRDHLRGLDDLPAWPAAG